MNIAQTANLVAKKLITLFLLEPRPQHYKTPEFRLYIEVGDFSKLLTNMVNESTDNSSASQALSILQTNLNAYGYHVFRSKVLGVQLRDIMVLESLSHPPIGREMITVGDLGFIHTIERERLSPTPSIAHHPGALDVLTRNPNSYGQANYLLNTRG